MVGVSSVMAAANATDPPCDNDSDGKHCKGPCSDEIFSRNLYEQCPEDTVEVNTLLLKNASAVRHITDLTIPAYNHGGRPLTFVRRASSRYHADTPVVLGSGGNWRHNWQWNIYRGATPHPVTQHETLIVSAPDGTQLDFTKPDLNQPYMTSRSSIHERIEKDPVDPNIYRLWYLDGSHLRIERFIDAGGLEYFLATRFETTHGLRYTMQYDSKRRVTAVQDPGNNTIQLIYGSIGNIGHALIPFKYDGNLRTTATKVSVAGDFNGWDTNAHTMNKGPDDVWRITLPIPLGTWAYKIVVDDTTWLIDEHNLNSPGIITTNGVDNSRLDVQNLEGNQDTSVPQTLDFSYAGSASSVYLVGSFNGWNASANPMTLSNGVWRTSLQLPPGLVHHYKFVVNQSDWIHDTANPFKMPDGYGGFNSIKATGIVTEALLRVEASNGHAVDYDYEVFSSGPAIYSTLTDVSYGDGTQAEYEYEAPNYYLNRPRIRTASDPRFGPKAGARIGYTYRPGTIEGYIASEYQPDTGVPFFTYDSSDPTVRTLTHANGLVEHLIFKSGNVQQRIKDSGGVGQNVSYVRHDDDWGMLHKSVDSLNRETVYTRTAEFGAIKRIDYPDGTYMTISYTNELKPFFPFAIRHRDGSTVQYLTRDQYSYPRNVFHSDGTMETFTYNSRGQVVEHLNRQNVRRINNFGGSQFRLQNTRLGDPLGVGFTQFTYNSKRLLASETLPSTVTASGIASTITRTYTYDLADRRTRIDWRTGGTSGPIVASTSTTFGDFGEILAETDSRGETTTYVYDSIFRRTHKTDPLGRVTLYEYGTAGGGSCGSCSSESGSHNPTRITSPGGLITEYEYDLLGRRTRETIAPGTPEEATSLFTYDSLGRLATSTNPEGLVTTSIYDPVTGRLTSRTESSPAGYSPAFVQTTTFEYDTVGNLTATVRPDGSREETAYDPHNRPMLRQTRNPDGALAHKESFRYDSLGQLDRVSDGRDLHTLIGYDGFGRRSAITRPDGRVQSTTYDNSSRPVSISGFDNLMTENRYDLWGRVTSRTHPDGTELASYEPGPDGKLLSSTVRGVTTSHGYDAAGRRTSSAAGGTTTTWAWNDAQRSETVTTGTIATTTFSDAAGRPSSILRGAAGSPPLSATSISYVRAAGTLTVSTGEGLPGAAPASVSATVYDSRGLMRSTTDANGDTTTYLHDALGRQVSYTNARGHTFSFEYDAAGRRTKRTEPDSTWQGQTYDLAGNLTQHRKADGAIVNTLYNNRNQPDYQSTSASGQWTDWNYDAVGRTTTVENQDVTLQYAYLTGSNLVQTETTIVKGLGNLSRSTTLSYDANKRPSGFSRAGVFGTTYGFDGAGRISSVTNHTPPPLALFSYNSAGLLDTHLHENGLTTSWTRDGAGRTQSVGTWNSGNVLVSGVGHTLDAMGRRTSATYEDGNGQAYAYDPAGQVTHGKVNISSPATANPTQSPTHAYTYDPAGNRNSSLAFGQNTSYSANSVNEYTSINGGGFQVPNPTYDDNGNALTLPRPNGTSQSLTWDIHNRLRSASSILDPQSTISYTYDPLGRLVWTRTTTPGETAVDEVWSWSGWTLLTREVLQGSNTLDTFRYTWGPDLSGSLEGAGGVGGLLSIEHAAGNSSTWDIRHVHYDANGNVIALTNSTGNISARYRYSPFGELISSQDLDGSGWNERNLHRFSTKPELAGAGLLYYGYRWYDPGTGRWPSRDPIEEVGGMNMYGFVGNNGILKYDYLGKITWEEHLRNLGESLEKLNADRKRWQDALEKAEKRLREACLSDQAREALIDNIKLLKSRIADVSKIIIRVTERMNAILIILDLTIQQWMLMEDPYRGRGRPGVIQS
jgi:RHS repeat-associated protein